MTSSDKIATDSVNTYEDRMTEPPGVWPVGTLIGCGVRNRAGEDIGKVEDIMLDLNSGRVAYVVLSFGGFLGIGDKLFAAPWDAFVLNGDEQEFLLDVDRHTLEKAPGFDKNSWPDMADPTWEESIRAHYGEPFFRSPQEAGTEPKVRKAGTT